MTHISPDEHPDFEAYAIGLVYASVCTCLDDDDATAWLNELFPTGIDSPWRIADEPFASGAPNPTPCDELPDSHRHVLFHC